MLSIFIFIYVLYIFYIVTMVTKANWDSLHLIVKILLAPVALVGVVMDFILQLCASIPFWDRPRDWLFTHRMNRYIAQGLTKRGRVARVICKIFLDPFQVGGHCRYGN